MSALKENGRVTPRPARGYTFMRPAAAAPSHRVTGWLVFAAMMVALAATLSVIWGIAAVSGSAFFVANANFIIISSLKTWGWIMIGLGALEGVAAASIWLAGSVGRGIGITVAGVAVVGAMLAIPAYPLWSLMLVLLDVLVIYALTTRGSTPHLTRDVTN